MVTRSTLSKSCISFISACLAVAAAVGCGEGPAPAPAGTAVADEGSAPEGILHCFGAGNFLCNCGCPGVNSICESKTAAGELACYVYCDNSCPPVATKVAISAASEAGCLLLSNGTVECWTGGTLEYPSAGGPATFMAPTYALATVSLPKAAIDIAAGTGVTATTSNAQGEFVTYEPYDCAVLTDNTVWCWGDNYFGTLGDGTDTCSVPPSTPKASPPVQVMTSMSPLGSSPLLATRVVANGNEACAITTAGGVACWGQDYFGELGDPSVYPNQATSCQTEIAHAVPVALPSGSGSAQAIAVGNEHACASTASGVYCWGANTGNTNLPANVLGTGSSAGFVITPAAVVGVPGTTDLVAATSTTCAVYGGQLECWGVWAPGYIASSSPVVIGPAPTALSSGGLDICEVAGGTAQCWPEAQATSLPSSNALPAVLGSATALANGSFTACGIVSGHVDCAEMSPTATVHQVY